MMVSNTYKSQNLIILTIDDDVASYLEIEALYLTGLNDFLGRYTIL